MKKVWIVDDNEEMGRAVGLMLKLLDCEVTLFLGARSAGIRACGLLFHGYQHA